MNYFAKVIKLDNNITKSKNRALKEALKSPYNYFFLVEENCEVLDPSVYDKFIEVSDLTDINALMWARGGLNKMIPFEDDRYIQYWSDFVSSFSMYTRKAVETVGLMDDKMPPNTWQELEYAKRIGDAGLSTPFGMFASPRGVDSCFRITKPKEEFKNLKALDEALEYWENKQFEDFPIQIKRKPEAKPITEML